MRVAFCSDEPYPVHAAITAELQRRGHDVVPFGAIATGHDEAWADVAEQAANAVASGACDEGIFMCWSGTGISIAANKVHGIRAALCTDPKTAEAARIWNHANVLCLSNRSLSGDVAKEILTAWFDTTRGDQGTAGVDKLIAVDARHRSR
jgi:ribose 5-phosphate isomerase B